jgi:hypothetical protein
MCGLCSTRDGRHDGSCSYRGPGWRTPERMIMRWGGPLLADDDWDEPARPGSVRAPGRRTAAETADAARAAAAMREAGHTHPEIAKALGCPTSYAFTLARRGAQAAGG